MPHSKTLLHLSHEAPHAVNHEIHEHGSKTKTLNGDVPSYASLHAVKCLARRHTPSNHQALTLILLLFIPPEA